MEIPDNTCFSKVASTLVQILPKNIFIAEKTKIRNDK
jgi:hypothetical protein